MVKVTEFVTQVRQEVAKVTWPTRRETLLSVMMVLIMVSAASLFFFVVDWGILNIVQLLLGLGK